MAQHGLQASSRPCTLSPLLLADPCGTAALTLPLQHQHTGSRGPEDDFLQAEELFGMEQLSRSRSRTQKWMWLPDTSEMNQDLF